MKMVATPEQIVAARGLLRLSQSELAKCAGVSRTSITRIEKGDDPKNIASLAKLQAALEEKGILFLPETDIVGDGVRFSKPEAERQVSVAGSDRGRAAEETDS
ncbi:MULTISPECIES: helix-turn-helix domain-containing protein [unclassified Rhizobium]|uniref:helix-turn-helix domain-containing protein n=1 Tax=unclassified Rhizobium TaxID=2613769 RepID=UPI00180A9599|nr:MULTISPECIES: helix-turn-helix domain-containing protein [unclassified Rhizobium]NKJ07893.1 putative transcriptional regulator [Rhizobium sp. SG741]NKJ36868.1 putative transcriptional regulator [Rhizobium sp. SG570]